MYNSTYYGISVHTLLAHINLHPLKSIVIGMAIVSHFSKRVNKTSPLTQQCTIT